MNKLDEQYQNLIYDILEFGVDKKDRTGTGTISTFGKQIRHNMKDGFPLLTTKRMAVKTMMTELKWFLKGDTNIKYLVDNGCKVWNGDAYKKYRDVYEIESRENDSKLEELHMLSDLTEKEFIDRIKGDDEFARIWGELGPIYGKQWRNWETEVFQESEESKTVFHATQQIDQIKNLINELKTNPDSRRLMVSAWNVGEISDMTLPPCHYGFQCYVSDLSPLEIIDQAKKDGLWKATIPEGMTLGELQKDFKTKKLSLMWNQRSVDTFLGLPFNIASYGMLLLLLCEEVGLKPGELIGNFGDTHLYKNHIEQAKELINRDSFDLPTIKLSNVDILSGEFDYELNNYKHHPTIKAPLSN
jgi:thymidylate synthase